MEDKFIIAGYFPAWKKSKKNKIRYDVFNRLYYSFAYPDENDLSINLPNFELAQDIITETHMNDVEVILSISGWSDFGESRSEKLHDIIVDRTKSLKLIDSISKIVKALNFDGIDIAWGNIELKDDEIELVNNFINRLSIMLHNDEKILSTTCFGIKVNNDIYSYESDVTNDKIVSLVDYVNVISYDVREGVRPTNANLKGEKKYDEEKKVPIKNDKAIYGIPFFANLSLTAYEEDLKNTAGELTDNSEIISCGREIYYSSNIEINDITNWTKNNTKGIAIWEATQDYTEAKNSILTKIKESIDSK